MNLNYHEDRTELKLKLKAAYRRLSLLVHPDKLPEDLKDKAKVAFQVLQNDNQTINDYLEKKETNFGKNSFKKSERKQQTKQSKQSQNKATGTHDEGQF